MTEKNVSPEQSPLTPAEGLKRLMEEYRNNTGVKAMLEAIQKRAEKIGKTLEIATVVIGGGIVLINEAMGLNNLLDNPMRKNVGLQTGIQLMAGVIGVTGTVFVGKVLGESVANEIRKDVISRFEKQ